MSRPVKNYIPRRPPSPQRGEPLTADEPRTLPDLFLTAAERFDRENALTYKRDGKWTSISSAEMIRRIENIALGLSSLGIKRGDRAAILAPNSPEWTLVDGGCQFAGIIDVPIYTTLAAGAVNYMLTDSGARVIFVEDHASYETLKDAIADGTQIESVIIFDAANLEAEGVMSLAALEKLGSDKRTLSPESIIEMASAVRPDDIATLIYTSGTTGEPKGVMLSQTNLVSNAIDAAEKYSFTKDDVSLSVLPLSHVFERTGMYVYILQGMAVHYAESIDKVPDNLKEVRPTIFTGVPRIFEKVYAKARVSAARSNPVRETIFDWAISVAKEMAMIRSQMSAPAMPLTVKHNLADVLVFSKMREFFGGNLRFCISGGAALSDEIYLIFTGAGIGIMQGYGLTETSPVISSNNPISQRLGTVGRPIRNVKIRTADDGEIEVSGPCIMQGYYKKPEATAEVMTPDGWFRTGDIGSIDSDGFLKITDRKKELFKTSGGKYIAPSPIEQMLRSSRFVSQAVLVGNERKFPAALIVPNFEMLESYAKHKDLKITTPEEFCSDPQIHSLFERQIESATKGLSQFEKVKKFALLPNELTVDGGELTPTLKIKRREIDQKYRSVIDAFYAD